MVWIYIQTLKAGKKRDIPYRLVLKNDDDHDACIDFNFKPEINISKRDYKLQGLDRSGILSAPPFCDSADTLIEMFQNQQLVFSEVRQFMLLKSLFKSIGYNFNTFPKYIFHKNEAMPNDAISEYLKSSRGLASQSLEYACCFVDLMARYNENMSIIKFAQPLKSEIYEYFNLSGYKMDPGVYFFLDASKTVIYVGKANQIKKRLQSHFSKPSQDNLIDYSKVKSIQVEYTGNDIVAQLVESANIKELKPFYNTQQIKDPAPYIINRGKTASGIHKLHIIRKELRDNMPECYFNRSSVKQSLENFCNDFYLCRKHCGIEYVKGPCSNVTLKNEVCVCADHTLISAYNARFEIAFEAFKKQKSRKIYKLKGRHKTEDAFIYTVNGIYEGYGFIEKSEVICSTNDILGHLIRQKNNYDTSRILSGLERLISKENIIKF